MSSHCPGCDGYMASWDRCRGLDERDLAGLLERELMEYARRFSGALPVRPEIAKVAGAFLGTMEARSGGGKPGLRWREQMDGYVLEWYCEPPRPKHRFKVMNEEWATENGLPVRRVYEIEEIHGAPGSTGGTHGDGPAGPAPGAGAVPETAAPAPQGG